jgi:hypothetical protein
LTLLTVVQKAARSCLLEPPSAVMTSGDETWLQFVHFSQETLEDMCARHDWSALWGPFQITGDGIQTVWDIAGMDRLARMPGVTKPSAGVGFSPFGPVDPAAWVSATTQNIFTTNPTYRISKSRITFAKPLAVGEVLTVSYQSANPIFSPNTSSKIAEWSRDDDYALIPENVVRLGTIWRWRQSRGLEFAKAESDYERALEGTCGQDSGMAIIAPAQPDPFGLDHQDWKVPQ